MDAALAANDREEWAALNRRFHLTISELPGLDLVKDLTAKVLDRWDRLRRFYFKGVLANRVEQAQEEHREILDAMRGARPGHAAGPGAPAQSGRAPGVSELPRRRGPRPAPEPVVAHDALRTPGSMIRSRSSAGSPRWSNRGSPRGPSR